MKILGIDPGTAIIGWAIVEQRGTLLSARHYGHIATSQTLPPAHRLERIAQGLSSLLAKYRPKEVAVESLFFFKNLKTVLPVAQARGVILLTLKQHGLEPYEYTPLQVKQAVTGYGRADKKQVQMMVKNVFCLDEIPTPDDVADALAIAFCHIS